MQSTFNECPLQVGFSHFALDIRLISNAQATELATKIWSEIVRQIQKLLVIVWLCVNGKFIESTKNVKT